MNINNTLVCSILKEHQEYINVTSVSIASKWIKRLPSKVKIRDVRINLFGFHCVYIPTCFELKMHRFAISVYSVTLPNKQKNFVQGKFKKFSLKKKYI